MFFFKWGILVGIVAVLLPVSGCGGGSGDDETATAKPAISKAALLVKGNAFCVKSNEELTAAFTPFIEEHRSDDVRFAVEHVIPMRKAQLRLLRRLGPPAEDAEQFEKMLVAMEEGLERARRDPHSLLATEEDYAFSRAFDIGLDFGLERCWLS
jgi:hypothetical protein